MDALLAMQLESLMLFSLVVAAFLLRFILVQLALSLHYKARYEQQLAQAMAVTHSLQATLSSLDQGPIIISPAQPAFDYQNYSLV